MRGMPPAGGVKSKGAVMLELARELKELREELEERRYGSDKDIPEPNNSQNVSKNRESSSNNNNNSSSLKESAAESAPPAQPPQNSGGGKQQRPSLISLFTGEFQYVSLSHLFQPLISPPSRSSLGPVSARPPQPWFCGSSYTQ